MYGGAVRTGDRPWTYDADRCYHGVDGVDGATIAVELFEAKGVATPTVLRELTPNGPAGEFNWGYIGTGTNTSAKAILDDALGYEPGQQLLQDFSDDVLSQATTEFRLRRGAVLRWVLGWATSRGNTNLPGVLNDLPPIDHTAYGLRPTRRSPA